MSNAEWLEDLVDEYPTKRSDKALVRLLRIFAEFSPTVMSEAVKRYMLDGNKFFPKVGDLMPYVKVTEENERGPLPYRDIISEKHFRYSDDEIHQWEMARGGYNG